jgi:hypothetical protein
MAARRLLVVSIFGSTVRHNAPRSVEIIGPNIGPSSTAGVAVGGEEVDAARIDNTLAIIPALKATAPATAMFLISIAGVAAGGEEVDVAKPDIIGNAPEMPPDASTPTDVNITPHQGVHIINGPCPS